MATKSLMVSTTGLKKLVVVKTPEDPIETLKAIERQSDKYYRQTIKLLEQYRGTGDSNVRAVLRKQVRALDKLREELLDQRDALVAKILRSRK